MKCSKCQFENPKDAGFCIECGAPMEFRCPKCGEITPASGKFCKKCGRDLREAKAAPPIDYSQPHSYTPKFLADKILTTRSAIEGERKLVTVLFADLANYTSMSEKLDPEEVHQIMDGCFKILLDEIHRYEGTIDKFTGDGVMALFGAPVAHEDHAQRACYAALAMQRALEEYGEKIRKECGVEFKMRVGLNSGPVIVGSVGDDLRMDYTAVGDTVNLASRMQTMARPGTVLVSADTHRMARDFFKFEPLGKVQVKGKEKPVEAYQLVEVGGVETRIEAAVARGLTKFVGRRREMAALQEAFEKAESGSGQVVCIVGEAGVGKSRLVLELRGMIPQEEYTYLEGRCLHYGGSMAYLPLIDILRSYFDIKGGEREFVIKKKISEKISRLDGKLKGILPPLHEILSLKVEDEEYANLDLQKKRERTFEAIRDLLIRESENKPLILAVEDLHWVDRTSEDFLTYFMGWLANARILLLLLYRPEYTHLWASKSCYNQIRVDQLSANTSAELVQYILEEGEVAPELRDLILNRAAGNPLFMEEFTHTLLENGSIQKKDHQYVLSRRVADIQVPDTIQGIVAARMDRLEENLKRTMQVASVIGRDFAYRILQTITGMREELKSYLLNLQGLEFIYEKSLFPELEYVFRHALTQEVAYNSLLLKRRKEIHQRIGKAIEELYPDRLEEFYEALAFHFKQGESSDKAIDYLIKSGEKSYDRYAVEEAHQHFKEAFDILSSKPSRAKEEDCLLIDLLLKWAYVFYFRGDFRGLTDLFQAHEGLAESLDDKARLGMFFGWLGLALYCRGKVKDSYRYLGKALKLGEEIEDQQVIGYACAWLTYTCFDLGLLDEAILFGERAQEICRSRESDRYLYFKSLGGLGEAYFARGEVKKVFEAGEALLEYGQRHTSIRSLGMGYVTMTLAHEMGGDFPSAIECATCALEVAVDPFWALTARVNLGINYVLNGQFQEGEDALQEALAYSQDFGIEVVEAPVQACLGLVAVAKGQMDEGIELAEGSLRPLRAEGRKTFYAQIGAGIGRVYALFAGQVPQADQKAEEHLNEAIEVAKEIGAKGIMGMAYLNLGLLRSAKGEKGKARECVSAAIELFEQCGLERHVGQAKEALDSLG
jgi:class 3 adenylate cyclase/tetratricopeptide (TPR) repeat protein